MTLVFWEEEQQCYRVQQPGTIRPNFDLFPQLTINGQEQLLFPLLFLLSIYKPSPSSPRGGQAIYQSSIYINRLTRIRRSSLEECGFCPFKHNRHGMRANEQTKYKHCLLADRKQSDFCVIAANEQTDRVQSPATKPLNFENLTCQQILSS